MEWRPLTFVWYHDLPLSQADTSIEKVPGNNFQH